MLSDTSFDTLMHRDYFANPTVNKNRRRKLGNNTYAYWYDDLNGQRQITITYHGNVIARLQYASEADLTLRPNVSQYLYVTDAGWGTVTTRERINEILSANHVQAFASQKNHAQILTTYHRENGERILDEGNKWNHAQYGFTTSHSVLFGFNIFNGWEII